MREIRHGQGSDAKQQGKEETETGQEQEGQGRPRALAVRTGAKPARLQPLRQEVTGQVARQRAAPFWRPRAVSGGDTRRTDRGDPWLTSSPTGCRAGRSAASASTACGPKPPARHQAAANSSSSISTA